MLRLADIVLLKAEAQNETGKTADAATTLNLVRKRVGLADVSTSLSQADLKKAILEERRLELAFEGQRWDDLVRSGTAVSTMLALNEYTNTCAKNKLGQDSLGIPKKMDYSKCNTNRLIFPIPQVEIDANPKLTQNNGY